MTQYYLHDLLISIIPVLAVSLLAALIFSIKKNPLHRHIYFYIAKSRPGKTAFFLLCFYGLIAALDTVKFPVFYIIDGKKTYNRSLSLLDRLYNPAREESYAAPLAENQLLDSDIKNQQRHILGTNISGEDVLANALKGLKTAFTIAGLTTLLSLPLGIFFGLLAGFYGKKTDAGITWFYSTLESIPEILLLIALMKVFGSGLVQLCTALGITSWVGLCRVVRGETLRQKNMEYVLSARTLGLSPVVIMLRHILPNIMHIVLISAVLRLSGLIMAEVILSYLGIGVPPGMASWGIMIDQARQELARTPAVWWNISAAFFFMFTLALAINYFGDALRDALDPRTEKH
ncbi:MAG: hypothetical protein A2096_08780 [Spirochaetes bacterium GWF1_41_5]|nr:MAG: hypothetical protein A2096_08780 [Spirochaetes bacterium GWF1_41_5]HBE04580.1 hypothetical protein [Spirochaetia bacterium]